MLPYRIFAACALALVALPISGATIRYGFTGTVTRVYETPAPAIASGSLVSGEFWYDSTLVRGPIPFGNGYGVSEKATTRDVGFKYSIAGLEVTSMAAPFFQFFWTNDARWSNGNYDYFSAGIVSGRDRRLNLSFHAQPDLFGSGSAIPTDLDITGAVGTAGGLWGPGLDAIFRLDDLYRSDALMRMGALPAAAVVATPEPATGALVMAAGAALFVVRRKRA